MMALYCFVRKPINLLWLQYRQKRNFYMKKSKIYTKCFEILGLSEDADQNTVRKRYIELVKQFHPDSGTENASIEKFREVDEAFKILLGKFAKNRRGMYDDDEEAQVFDIKHTAPQHRQYLSFDGVGYGTPAQRQRQFDQHKVLKAQERMLEFRVEKMKAQNGDLIEKANEHKIKTKYGFDRIVEDLIQHAMANGDFNNLPGTGKPLPDIQSQNPYLDFTTHKLNKILIDNGFTPEWIVLQRDIRNKVQALRDSLADNRQYLGDLPFSAEDTIKWEIIVASYKKDVEDINKMIEKFNLIVPIINKQLFKVKLSEVSENVLNDSTLPFNKVRKETAQTSEQPANQQTNLLSSLFSLFS